ncbi:MAG: hypothetical protein AAFZ18_10520 [Myxococcota bacterium]
MSDRDGLTPRRRMTRGEGEALVTAWRRSGLGPSEFCRSRGVTVNRLSYWRSRTVAETNFIEAVVEEGSPDSPVVASAEAIELVVGDVFLRLPDRPGRAAEILALLGKAPA